MRPDRESVAERTRRILSLSQGIFAIAYLIMAYYVITYKWFMIPLNDTVAYAFGGLLVLYGLYRLYRSVEVLQEYFKK